MKLSFILVPSFTFFPWKATRIEKHIHEKVFTIVLDITLFSGLRRPMRNVLEGASRVERFQDSLLINDRKRTGVGGAFLLSSRLVALKYRELQQEFYNHEVTRIRINPNTKQDYKARKSVGVWQHVKRYISLEM